jgi:hypothetical protein
MLPIDFCKPENAVGEPTVIYSPSKRFSLTVQHYKTGEKTWNYTSGVFKDGEEVITTIYRNYSDFFHNFFLKNGTEWVVCGASYMSQTFIDLETRTIFERPADCKDGFCWADVKANPSGTLLLVCGCVWAAPYEFKIYDFSDPSKGWPCIPMVNADGEKSYVDDGFGDRQDIRFNSDTECTIEQMYLFNETAQKWTEDMSDDEEDSTSAGKKSQLRTKYSYKLRWVDGKIIVDDQSPTPIPSPTQTPRVENEATSNDVKLLLAEVSLKLGDGAAPVPNVDQDEKPAGQLAPQPNPKIDDKSATAQI